MGRAQGSKKPGVRERISVALDHLEEVYGKPRFLSRFEPLDELVSCILSQHTADANSFPAFTKLRATYPEWQDVVDAGPERVADVVRQAGLANQKAKNIVKALCEIKARNGEYSLENLRPMPMEEARNWLLSLPGVGPKTASIVLCFSFGMGAIPVDTHVFRVSHRLGFLPKGTDEKRAHYVLLKRVQPEDAFRFHSLLIQHGRHLCSARKPSCPQCPLAPMCPYLDKTGQS